MGVDLEDGSRGLASEAYLLPQSLGAAGSEASLNLLASEGPGDHLPPTRVIKKKKKKKGGKTTKESPKASVANYEPKEGEPYIAGLAEVRALKA